MKLLLTTLNAKLHICICASGEGMNYGVPVAFLDSSSSSLSCLNRRLKNPVSFSLDGALFGESGFAFLEELETLLLGGSRKCILLGYIMSPSRC